MSDFWIHPTYFELNNNEIIEVAIIFHPSSVGLHLETLYVICDNNSFNEVEVMGDAIYFSRTMIRIDVGNIGKNFNFHSVQTI